MVSCFPFCHKRRSSESPRSKSRTPIRISVTGDKDHEGDVFFDVISEYRDKRTRGTNEDLISFHSFGSALDVSREVSRHTVDATPAAAVSSESLRQRGMLKCSKTGEFYGYRERIPSDVGNHMEHHPESYWWSNANLQTYTIARDMGSTPTVLSRVIKVSIVPSSYFASHRDIEVFPEYLHLCEQTASADASAGPTSLKDIANIKNLPRPVTPRPRISLIIFKIKMNDQVLVSLNEVINEAEFDRILINQYSRDELLKERLKLIVSPINTPLPIPVKKPNDAETIGSYFGMDNVDLYFDESLSSSKVRVVSVLINIYSKWIIRKFLPVAISSVGRICDFVLLSSDDKVVFADFRLLCTNVSKTLMKGVK
jgi:hypothetical protein